MRKLHPAVVGGFAYFTPTGIERRVTEGGPLDVLPVTIREELEAAGLVVEDEGDTVSPPETAADPEEEA